jgi:hypothetical protein
MDTTSVVTPSPLAVVRQRLGCATFAGWSLKPISQGFMVFFEALFCTVVIANADAVETLAHLNISGQPTSEDAAPFPDTTAVDNVIKTANHTIDATINDNEEPSQPSNDNLPLNAAEPPITEVSALASHVVADEIASCTEETGGAAEHVPAGDSKPDAEPAIALTSSSDNITTINNDSDSQPDSREVEETAGALTVAHTEADHASFALEDIPTTDSIPAPESVAECTPDTSSDSMAKNVTDLVEDTAAIEETLQAASHEDTSSVPLEEVPCTAAVTPAEPVAEPAPVSDEALDSEELAEFPIESQFVAEEDRPAIPSIIQEASDETALETGVQNTLDMKDAAPAVQNFTDKHFEEETASIPTPAPLYALTFEDDFDAATSSIFDTDIGLLMDIDISWSVPQIIEKGKSEREIVRERPANRSTALFNRQNLILEKAARALSIDGSAPVAKATQPVDQSALMTPLTPTTPATPASPVELEEAASEAQIVVQPKAEDKINKSQEASSDNEEAAAKLGKETSARPSHSRSTSSSSNASKVSAEADFDTAPCPGTPVTEYSTTPVKGDASRAITAEEAISQQPADANLIVSQMEDSAGNEAPQGGDETTE